MLVRDRDVGPAVAVVASYQAAEALKLAAGIGEPMVGQLLLLDALDDDLDDELDDDDDDDDDDELLL